MTGPNAEPEMTWIPTGTRFLRKENWVTLAFPNENDAIMFVEIMQNMAERAGGRWQDGGEEDA